RDGQDRRIGLAPLLTQGREHDVEDRAPMAENVAQSIIERTRIIAVRRGDELVIEAILVEEAAEHRVVVPGEALLPSAERIGNAAQRLSEMRGKHLLVGDVVRNLAKTVHVVAKRNQPRRIARQLLISAAD